ncbi:MAG TPA: YfiR family protein [Tepidisphaeraceae bacterium]|nr:YfiR family protein [Tepidisphaeraceae bacterium]
MGLVIQHSGEPCNGWRVDRQRRVLRSLASLTVVLILSLASPSRALADEATEREYQVKAAMIFNFAQFTEWPADTFQNDGAPFIFATVGTDPFHGTLEQSLAGKIFGGRPVTVVHFASVKEIRPCQVLFVSKDQDANLKQIMQIVRSKPTLTVGETDAFPWSGGVIRFYMEDNKIRFEINPKAAMEARLTISSKMMKLARIFRA